MGCLRGLAFAGLLVGCGDEFVVANVGGEGGAPAGGMGGAGAGGSGGGGSGGGGAGGGMPTRCGGTGVLGDDYEDGALPLDFLLFSPDPGTFAEVEGQLTVAADGMGGIASSRHYHLLRDDALWLEVVDAAQSASPGPEISLRLSFAEHHHISITVEDGFLRAQAQAGDNFSQLANVPYDPAAHRWWQLRDAEGSVFWEVSSDGADWVVLGEVASADFPDAYARVSLTVYPSATPSSAALVRFDNLNGGVATQSWCKADALSDAFDDGVAEPHWKDILANNCSWMEQDGVRFDFLEGGGHCGLDSSSAFDLRGSHAGIGVDPGFAGSPPPVTAFGVRRDEQNALGFELDDNLRLVVEQDGMGFLVASFPYDASEQAYLRLREEAGEVVWETSPDGVSFTQRGSAPAPFDLSAVDVRASAALAPEIQSGSLRLFDYNLAP